MLESKVSRGGEQVRRINIIERARLAVLRNIAFATLITLGCVLLVLLVFNRPLVYRIFPWVEPKSQSESEVVHPGDGIYTVTTQGQNGYGGMQLEVVDPTLRPDLYVTVEFVYACGCPGSFVPANGGYMEKHYPDKAKADREKAICYQCRQKLEYLEQRKEIEESKGQ